MAAGFLGAEQFAKEGRVPLRILMQGQETIGYLVVRTDSGIKTAADLRGKIIAVPVARPSASVPATTTPPQKRPLSGPRVRTLAAARASVFGCGV